MLKTYTPINNLNGKKNNGQALGGKYNPGFWRLNV